MIYLDLLQIACYNLGVEKLRKRYLYVEATTMNEIFAAISSIGFPSVVSIYLLVRFESKISDLTLTIHSLEKSIEKLNARQ